jgi:hypothetical protein
MFIGLFFIVHDFSSISPGLVAAGAASSIPIGFLLYQAYTANAFWLYGYCNQRQKQRCLASIERAFRDSWKDGKQDEIHHLSKRVLTIVVNRDEKMGAYIWRLVAIVNTRGVSLFAVLVAAFAPSSYLLLPTLSSSPFWPTRLAVFYVILLLTALSLLRGIPKVRGQLDAYQELVVADQQSDIKKMVERIVRERTLPCQEASRPDSERPRLTSQSELNKTSA